jgi:hypothetical protein
MGLCLSDLYILNKIGGETKRSVDCDTVDWRRLFDKRS